MKINYVKLAIPFMAWTFAGSLRAEINLPAEVKAALDSSHTTESGRLLPETNEKALGQYMNEHWQEVITPEIKSLPIAKRNVLYSSCGILSPPEYLKFLQLGRKLNEQGAIDDEEFIRLSNSSNKKQAFLTVNLHNPEARELYLYTEMVLLRAGYPTEKLETLDEEKLINDAKSQIREIDPTLLPSIQIDKSSTSAARRAERSNTKGLNSSSSNIESGQGVTLTNQKGWMAATAVVAAVLAIPIVLIIRRKKVRQGA